MDSKEKQSKFTTNVFFNLIISSKIDTVSQGDILDRLSCVYKLGDKNTRPSKETLSTYATNFKKGEKPLTTFFGFDNLVLNNKFKDDIKSDHPMSLTIMKDFVDKIIDQEQYTDLVKCILMFIDNDDTIKDEDDFYLFEIKTFVHKRDFCSLNTYYIDSFLLSVWYYLVEHCNAYTNKNAFLHYFEKKDALRSINNIKREINVDRYSDNNRELADEYSKLKQNADAVEKKSDKADKNSDIKHKENVLNVNTKYLVQNDKFNSSADSDFDVKQKHCILKKL